MKSNAVAKTYILIYTALILFVFAIFPAFAVDESKLGENEVKLGREGMEQVKNEYKFIEDEAILNRVREIGNKIAKVANEVEIPVLYGSPKKTPFEYEFYVIEDKSINAFALPGGFIFINTGLLDFVESDDELAALIAHEITHAAHHHMVYIIKQRSAFNSTAAIAMLAAIFSGGKNADVGHLLLGAQLYQIAKINDYTKEAERDADHGAVMYSKLAGYNPVGYLTLQERLAQKPELIEYGIYRTHPINRERIANTKYLLSKLDVEINRRAVTNAIKAEVKAETEDVESNQIWLDGKLIYKTASIDGKSAAERAYQIAEQINLALDANLKMHEITTNAYYGVVAKGNTILAVTDQDAELMQQDKKTLVNNVSSAIKSVVLKQIMKTIH
ncbi:MAG: M48 family metalloprotease [Armatimonadota bacterium]